MELQKRSEAAEVDKPINYWQPQDKQRHLLEVCGMLDALEGGEVHPAQVEKIGYGGAAGGGKTEGLIGLALIACMMVPGVKIGIFRRTFAELEGSDGPIDRSMELYGNAGGTYNQAKHVWDFENGAAVRFCHCQHEKDVYKYQSQAFDILIIDQAEHFSWFIIDYLFTRNRPSKNSQLPHVFSVFTANPGGIGHLWYMRLFDVDASQGEHCQVKKCVTPNEVEEDTYFIPALLEDNPILLERDPEYEIRLMKREPTLAKALRFGDWTVFSGQVFREWNKERHVCKPFEIPEEWPRWRGIDWGFAAPFACLWFAKNPLNGHIYVYRELYKAGLTDPQQAKAINENSLPNEHFTFTFADPSMWTRRTTNEVATSTYDVYLKHSILLTKADNDHVNKKRKVHAVLGDMYDEQPVVKIFDTCKNLISTLPALISDPKRPEEIMDGQEDHAFDAFAYGLTNWRDPAIPGKKKKQSANNPWNRVKDI